MAFYSFDQLLSLIEDMVVSVSENVLAKSPGMLQSMNPAFVRMISPSDRSGIVLLFASGRSPEAVLAHDVRGRHQVVAGAQSVQGRRIQL